MMLFLFSVRCIKLWFLSLNKLSFAMNFSFKQHFLGVGGGGSVTMLFIPLQYFPFYIIGRDFLHGTTYF